MLGDKLERLICTRWHSYFVGFFMPANAKKQTTHKFDDNFSKVSVEGFKVHEVVIMLQKDFESRSLAVRCDIKKHYSLVLLQGNGTIFFTASGIIIKTFFVFTIFYSIFFIQGFSC